MSIPVFVSTPTILSPAQEASREYIEKALRRSDLDPKTVGETDYCNDLPLKEVYAVGRHCSGGVVLGFEQIRVTAGLSKPGTLKEESIMTPLSLPTPWNQLEAGILFGLGLPLLIFREEGVVGGVFDLGATDVFIHNMPMPAKGRADDAFRQVLDRWRARVITHYYRDLRLPVG